jgi:glycosyltransferase involved in cell wall biosynthesis
MALLMKEESELNPDFADTLPLDLPESFLEQCTEEALMADVILAGSDYVKSTMVSYGANPARVAVIPYRAELTRFTSTRRAQEGKEDGKQDSEQDSKFRVLFAGHLSQRKGIKYLLEAVRRLKLPQLELTLVGGVIGSGAGLSHYPEYFKHTPNVPHYRIHEHFQRADIFVYPSLHEGSAIAIYEALACGLPVITTPNSGSVVRDGIEGFIVPIRDVEALMEKILLLYGDSGLRAEIARNAYSRGRQFGWNDYRAQVGGLIRSMLLDSTAHRLAGTAETGAGQLHAAQLHTA